jgi:recombination protein RecT
MSEQNKNTLAVQEKTITDSVLNRVRELEASGNIQFPPNYSYSNALKSAWLILQETKTSKKDGEKPALDVCTKESIMNSLLDMVIQGLSPAKKQCYFIAYGKKLQLSRSYIGTVAVTKRLKGIKDVKAYCVYEGDEFETEFDVETATLRISKFNPKFENINITKIKGAFAVVVGEEGPVHLEIMSMAQIKAAWGMGFGEGKVHKEFTEEMAKKTVINRACKMYVNTSDDSDILVEAFNNATESDYKQNDSETEVKQEIAEKANKKNIGFSKEEVQDVEYEEVKEEPKEAPAVQNNPQQQSFTVEENDPGF